jgi:vancomycin resistance protein YoaR
MNTTYPRAQNRIQPQQILIVLLVGAALFFGFLAASLFGFELLYMGRIYPGVSVAGIDVSGLNADKAAAKITEEFAYPSTGQLVLSDEQLWLTSPGEMGLYLDPQTSAQTALQIGRSGGVFNRLSEQFETWYYRRDLPPALIFDQRRAHDFLTRLSEQINIPVVEPSLRLEGTQVIVQPGQAGRKLNIDTTLAMLTAQMRTLQDGIIPLLIEEIRPTIPDVTQQAELAQRILSQPLVIQLPSDQPNQKGPWEIEPARLAQMLKFERVVDGPQANYRITLDAVQLSAKLQEIAPQIQTYPQNARFIFNDDTRQLDLIEPAVIGRDLNLQASLTQTQEKVLQGEHTIDLALNLTNPAITDSVTGSEIGITELVHAETSFFYGSSASRVQNITAAARRFHGLLIAPGETFSMANALGDISLDNGYAEALIIYGNQTIQGVGGGVCQVSTTLFRAAFFAGYPINERHAHAYRVSYYEKVAGNKRDNNLAGLDATVYVPVVDFKFTNDTPYWLLMETYVNPSYSSLIWKFYSTKDGRSMTWETTGPRNIVEAPKPRYIENPELSKDEVKQIDWEAEGADITVRRTVYKDGQTYLTDTFNTHYQPWQAAYEYGPGTEGYPPEEEDN